MEIKGEKLLRRDRFKWACQAPPLDESGRRKNALNFLNSGAQKRTPRRDEFTAFGQACIAFATGVFSLLVGHGAKVFAVAIPTVRAPPGTPVEYLRKDHVFLLERYFYFLEEKQEHGLLVMDGSDKQSDRQFVKRMERYFTLTMTGKRRTAWIVPTPFFVESDMAYGVQIADVIIYSINWGLRLKSMTQPVREDLSPLAQGILPLIWHGDGYKDGQVFSTHGFVYVPDPFEDRRNLFQK